MKRVLLTTIPRPLGKDKGTCSKHIQAEMYHAQVTRAQGIFSIRTICTGWGLDFMAANLDEAEVDGIEAEARWLPSDGLYLRASYTWKDAQDGQGGELLRHPRHSGAVSVAWETDRYRLSGRALFMGSLLDVPLEGFDARVDAWQRVDVSGALRLDASGSVMIQGTIENLLDQEYQELKGFPAPGIQARIGVRAGF